MTGRTQKYFQRRNRSHGEQGFSLIEIIITIAIFLILAGGIYFSYANMLEVISRTRTRTLAITLLNKHIEYIRNLEFDDVGIVGGFPSGLIPASTTVSYEGQDFVVYSYVRSIDDPFDGSATGTTPKDTAPADYRLVELQAHCPRCFNFAPVLVTTWVAPQNLESSSQNGSLFINVFDSNGVPVSNANIVVTNTALNPDITIYDSTNASGSLQLIDIPTSTTAYEITVSKNNYSSARTYTPGDAANPNPIQPHATIATQQVTLISFAIDKHSQIDVISSDQYCAPAASVDFTQTGAKLIGSGPNVIKYTATSTTNTSGVVSRTGLEWDTYSFTTTDTAFSFAGSIPLLPLTLSAGTTTTLRFLMEPFATTSLLATIIDDSGAPISGVAVTLDKTGFSSSAQTGEKVWGATNWKGTSYTSQDGLIDTEGTAGQMTLIGSGTYPTSTNSYFISGTFDFGSTSTTYKALWWSPVTQASSTSLKFQIGASNNSTGPFSFTGPDGTSSSYYTASSTLPTTYDNNRYLQYKAFLNTTDSAATPLLTDISISFASPCVPSGQVFFPGISTGVYTLTASKAGYTTATSSVTVSTGAQEARLILNNQ